MLIASIPITDYMIAHDDCTTALAHGADMIELRLDYLTTIDFVAIADLRNAIPCPVMFTLRKISQGGLFQGTEQARLQTISQLCALHPDYFDLEYDISHPFANALHLQFPDIKIICSYHDYQQTPADLMVIWQQMQNPYAYAYKIATLAQSTSDALRMLLFIKKNATQIKITGIGMGEYGQCTRVLARIVGSTFCYASISDHHVTAPGQLSLKTLINIYHYPQLNLQSRIYALLGDPIQQSVGHLLHNQALVHCQQNAVYIKLKVSAAELTAVLSYCRELPFAGLSITMPLKEVILPYLTDVDDNASAIAAVNTIVINNGQWLGFNTDGLGAVTALPKTALASNPTVVILGAGGTAKAIATTLRLQGANVIVFNRTVDKAKALGDLGYALSELHQLKTLSYAIIINTLPITMHGNTDMATFLTAENLLPNTIAMDVVYNPINTAFLKIAHLASCSIIPGYKMFIQQALLQITYWYHPNQAQLAAIQEQMENYFLYTHYT